MLWLWRLKLKGTSAVADAYCCCVAFALLRSTRQLGPLCLSGLLVIDWNHTAQEAIVIVGITKTRETVVTNGTGKALEEANLLSLWPSEVMLV